MGRKAVLSIRFWDHLREWLGWLSVYLKAGSRFRAIWSDVAACCISAGLFFVLPFREWLGGFAFLILTLCPLFMSLPTTLIEIVDGTLLVIWGFLVATGVGILGFVLAEGRVGAILLFFFVTTFIFSTALNILNTRYNSFLNYVILFNYLVVLESTNKDLEEAWTFSYSMIKSVLFACILNVFVRLTIGFPGYASVAFRRELAFTLSKYAAYLRICRQALVPDAPDDLVRDLIDRITNLNGRARDMAQLTINARKEYRIRFDGVGLRFVDCSEKINSLHNSLLDFGLLSIRRIEELEDRKRYWSEETLSADSRLRDELMTEVTPIFSRVIEELETLGANLQVNDVPKLIAQLAEFKQATEECKKFGKKLSELLLRHVPSESVPDWPLDGSQVSQILYLGEGLPSLFQEVEICGQAIARLNRNQAKMFSSVADWGRASEWVKGQLSLTKFFNINRFLYGQPRATTWWETYGMRISAAAQGGLRTAVTCVLVGLFGFLPSTSGLFTRLNGFAAIATVMVLAPERQLGQMIRKGLGRPVGIAVAIAWSWIAWVASRGDVHPGLAWWFHVPLYIASAVLSRVYDLGNIGSMMALMFALSFDTFAQETTANGCVLIVTTCASQFRVSGFRLIADTIGIFLVLLSSVLIDPVFAADDLRNELFEIARFVYMQYSLRIQDIMERRDLNISDIAGGERDQVVASIKLIQNQILQRTLVVENLVLAARWEPRVAGHYDVEKLKRMNRDLWIMSNTVAVLMWYDTIAADHWGDSVEQKELLAGMRLRELRDVAQKLLVDMYASAHTLKTGDFVPFALEEQLRNDEKDLTLEALQNTFSLRFTVGKETIVHHPSINGGEEVISLDLSRNLPQIFYLKLTSHARMSDLLRDLNRSAMELYGHDKRCSLKLVS